MVATKRMPWTARFVALASLLGTTALPGSGLVAPPAGIAPTAVGLLEETTRYLGAQERFAVETRSSIEAVLDSGQKIQFDQAARLSVDRPDKLRAERVGDVLEQVLFYDGETLTLVNPEDGYYATVAAPGTIEQALDFART